MGSTLLINAAGRETRVALVEDGHIAEFYLERKKDRGIVGNIYKGRVVRVLPGMQAAFVDVGLDKAAFLYVGDVVYDPELFHAQFELTEGEHQETDEVPEESAEVAARTTTGELPVIGAELPDAEGEGEEPGGDEPGGDEPGGDEPGDGPEAAAAGEPDADVADEPTPSGADIVSEAIFSAPATAEPSTAEPPSAAEVAASLAEAHEPPSGNEVTEPVAANAPPITPITGAEIVAEALAASQSVQLPPSVGLAGPTTGERRAPSEARPRDKQVRGERRPEEKRKERKQSRIEDLLKPGQEVVVQISKDPIGTKGARLTSHISIPGRHLVFMPTVDHVGISRRISNEKERRRLRELVDRFRPPGTGFIVRTVAENVPAEKLEADIRFLIQVWNETIRKNEQRKQPGLLHSDLDLILRATRDLFASDVEELVIDDRDEYERVLGFVEATDPALKSRVLLHDSDEPVFDAYGVEDEIRRATARKVWLKSGGYLIMDQAEALTAIDVNSGRYVGKKTLEETITKINIEAAKEIVYQLRLRNIGGIIICDFIDMEKQQSRDKVFRALQEALGRDKAKTNVLRISELGLVEMTRKRVRESIGRMLHEDCAYCEGQGFVKTTTTVCYEIFRDLRRESAAYKDPVLVISCSPDVARMLQTEEREELRHLMDRFNKTIQVRPQGGFHREQYDIYGRSLQGVEQKLVTAGEGFDAEGYGSPKRGGAQEQPSRNERRDRERGRDRDRGRKGDRGRDRDRGRGGQPQAAPGPGPSAPSSRAPATDPTPAGSADGQS